MGEIEGRVKGLGAGFQTCVSNIMDCQLKYAVLWPLHIELALKRKPQKVHLGMINCPHCEARFLKYA